MAETTFTVTMQYRSSKEILEAAEAGTRSRLTFDFLDDLSPIAPIEVVVDAYRSVFAATTVKKEIVEGMLPLWLHGHISGQARIARAALAPLRDRDVSWGWPLFDHSRARFRQMNLWPESWEYFKDEALDRRRSLRDPMVDLLDRWLWQRIAARKRAADFDSDSLFNRWGWFLSSAPFENNQRLVDGMEATVVLGEADTYPPFFPGDASELRLRSRPGKDTPPSPSQA